MLFNSFPFLFGFLPITLGGYLLLVRAGHERLALAYMIGASSVFYAYWHPPHVFVFWFSVCGNFVLGRLIVTEDEWLRRRLYLIVGIAANLTLLGYFKYRGFFTEILIGEVHSSTFMGSLTNTVLPIGISFYTFQQIAYLVDVAREPRHYRFEKYAFFISFFPHLIAGPLLHHRLIIPQIERLPQRLRGGRYMVGFVTPGLALLVIGLAKKVILADTFGHFADPTFDAAAKGAALTFLDAWGGAAAYGLQIYFDFSAYSDMAIGLGLMFGVRLPVNFNSPYKATSIIDFWRRWHITLSRFLRDYLYIPLGGSHGGEARHYLNIMITMLLGGLWHGAGYTFIVWGGIHGALIVLNHAWRRAISWQPPVWLAVPATLTLVFLAWVPFRASSLSVALEFWRAMLGFDGIAIPALYASVVAALGPIATLLNIHVGHVLYLDGWRQPLLLALGLALVLGPPNAMVLLRPEMRRMFLKSRWAAAGVGMALAASIVTIYVNENATFLYFQF